MTLHLSHSCRRIPILLSAQIALLAAYSASWAQENPFPTFSDPFELMTVESSPITEASGLVVSWVQPHIFFTHNDGSKNPEIIVLNNEGGYLATVTLKNQNSGDFEDIASGPGPDPHLHYLYLGDIGDNQVNRDNIVVYRLPEPWIDAAWSANAQKLNAGGVEAFKLAYPDQAHDAETLLVDPLLRELLILTKESGVCRIYRFPIDNLSVDDVNTLEWVGDVPFHTASGGGISRDGRQILLRQEDYARWWARDPALSVGEAMQSEAQVAPVVGRPTEPNGEAITWSPEGNSYFTISDSTTKPVVYQVTRNNPPFGVAESILVPQGASWRYLDDGSNQGTLWRAPGFVDSAWKSGRAALGYGDDTLATVVSYGSSTKKRHITTYFRTSFNVSDPTRYTGLDLHVLYDDGCAIYLNGVEVVRANLPTNATSTTLAPLNQSDFELVWFNYPINPTLLRSGVNVLAVEMHQNTQDSKDLRFDLQLSAQPNTASRIVNSQFTDGGMKFELQVPTLEPFQLQSSENLTDWETVKRVEPVEPSVEILDTRPLVQQRFYRLRP